MNQASLHWFQWGWLGIHAAISRATMNQFMSDLVYEGFSSCSTEIWSWKCWNAKKKIWWSHTRPYLGPPWTNSCQIWCMRVFHHVLLKYGHENAEMQKRKFDEVTLQYLLYNAGKAKHSNHAPKLVHGDHFTEFQASFLWKISNSILLIIHLGIFVNLPTLFILLIFFFFFTRMVILKASHKI